MHDLPHGQPATVVTQPIPNQTIDGVEKANPSPRSIECYTADVSGHEVKKLFVSG